LGRKVDYVSICSPNYLHDAHIRFALRVDAHAICEKPIVLNPWNIDALQELESEANRRVYCILQLRNHPSIQQLRERHHAEPQRKRDISLTYVTSRGKWYLSTWKGQVEKSGGLTTNIGIHFFDMLMWIFGDVIESRVHMHTDRRAGGFLELERARIRWFLSIDRDDLPDMNPSASQVTYRSITIDGEEVEFSDGFGDLHTVVYNEILAGRGYGMQDARPSIELAHHIRNADPVGLDEQSHPMTKLALERHGERILRARERDRGFGSADRQRDPSLAL
jgi:UDP-N-acetyl-2-amino-2-deoxyglucuronate dehydrogenase